jgi:hypothetical protein
VKKFVVSLVLVALGAGAWWVTARTARFSIKKWDAKFETVLRHTLTDLGLTDQDLVSSTHEVKKDRRGEWVVQHLSLKMTDPEKQKELAEELHEAGGRVEQRLDGRTPIFVVRRGSRVYQEIRFVKP